MLEQMEEVWHAKIQFLSSRSERVFNKSLNSCISMFVHSGLHGGASSHGGEPALVFMDKTQLVRRKTIFVCIEPLKIRLWSSGL